MIEVFQSTYCGRSLLFFPAHRGIGPEGEFAMNLPGIVVCFTKSGDGKEMPFS